jgi:hypothetical protein
MRAKDTRSADFSVFAFIADKSAVHKQRETLDDVFDGLCHG